MILRALAPSLAFAMLSFACGGTTADLGGGRGGGTSDGGATPDSATDSASPLDGGSQECPRVPGPQCSDGCGGYFGPSCVNGQWVCPALTQIACPVDAAAPEDAGCPLTPIACASGCGGTVEPVCVNGAWVCQAQPGHKCPAPVLPCGTLSCNGFTQYCEQSGGGPLPLDGSVATSDSCNAIPAQCQQSRTCACIQPLIGGGCGCSATADGFVTIGCFFP